MTDYQDNLDAKEQIPFIELFKFQRGQNFWYYTSYNTDIEFSGQTYVAVSIERSEFSADTNLSTVSCTVTGAVLDEFGVYVSSQPAVKTIVTIYRAVSDDTDEYVILTKGKVIGISFKENNTASLKIEESACILNREIDMVVHSATCNHVVFNSRCRLDPLEYRCITNVTPIDSTLVSEDFGSYDDGYFTGGEVFTSSDSRLITKHVGNTVWLHVPFTEDEVSIGTQIEALPGCDRLPSTCEEKFDNRYNFSGMPYIPNKNPSIWGV